MISTDRDRAVTLPSPASGSQLPASRGEHVVRGLDSIRFWCALWVYFSHFGFLPLRDLALPRLMTGAYNNLFCGVAAVIAFFVISGFCIHYPFQNTAKFPLGAFYLRRYIRISGPLAAALLLGRLLGENMAGFYQTIIWSLIAELIYYTIYPAIRPALQRWPGNCLIVAYAAAFAVIGLNPRAFNFHQFGPELTWVVGLPSWLLGCRLANWASLDRSTRITAPWLWRGSVWATSSLASVLRFHGHIGYPPTLTLFGILAFLWIREEIRYYRNASPPVFAEWCGRWSYSIYLMHGLAALAVTRAGLNLNPRPRWMLQTIAVLFVSFCFYLVVEMPSHRLARFLARLARKRERGLPDSLLIGKS